MTAVGNIFFFTWEIYFMEWLQARLSAAGVSIISAFSIFGEEMLLIAVMGFFYWSYDKKMGKFIGLNMLCANLWGNAIKDVVLRLRPYYASDKIDLLRKVDNSADIYDVAAQGYSFPSGHSANAVAVFGSIGVWLKKRWALLPAILLPLLCGFSRVAVGAHYPTDVFAGWILGLLAIIIAPALSKVIKHKWLLYLILIAPAIPTFFLSNSNAYFSSLGMIIGYAFAESFEERFVNFENTRNPIRAILRVVGGGAVYFGMNYLLKLPFSSEFLSDGSMASHIVRTLRYAIVIFTVIAIYPMVFKLTAKIGQKKQAE